MGSRFYDIAFTPAVERLQALDGSRAGYARAGASALPDALGPDEAAFIGERDSFYLATVSETGWPYLQHRGGPKGFLKLMDAQTVAFADFRGNRQHLSEGNLAGNDRAALFLMDYPNRRRLKLLGRARVASAAEEPELAASLADPGYPAKVERVIAIRIEAFNWNCRQHITPRFSEAELAPAIDAMQARIRELEAQLKNAGRG